MVPATEPLLAVRSLDVHLGRHRLGGGGARKILDGIDVDIAAGEVVGLIGETGSGKTTFARTLAGLYRPSAGEIRFAGQRVSGLGGRAAREFRRSGSIQLVFQSPLRSLDPDMCVGDIIGEGLAIRGGLGRKEIHERAADALDVVGLPSTLLRRRPSEISGGQRQRVAIARAVVMDPKLIIFDEPVSALDVSTRNYVLKLLLDLRDRLGVAMVVISHDLTSIVGVGHRVLVLYHGSLVEAGRVADVFARPQHPYTGLLVASAPSVVRARAGFDIPAAVLRRLATGQEATAGCPYAPRCPFATEICRLEHPPPTPVAPAASVRCHHFATWRDSVAAACAVDGAAATPAARSR